MLDAARVSPSSEVITEKLDMSGQNLNASAQQRSDRSTNPGDEAPPGTVGTGDAICPDCAGTGRKGAERCPNCNGTGKVIRAVGGA